jgi:4'-phosphopantetheinyl transferase
VAQERLAQLADVKWAASDVTVVWTRAAEAGALLRTEVARVLGTSPEGVQVSRSCLRCGSSDHGRPVVLGKGATRAPYVSLSRAGEIVVVAVSCSAPVGVDVERHDAARFAGFDDVALHPHEIAPTIEARATTWVRKESLLKATGDALHLDPRLVRLSDPDLPPELVEWSAPNPPAEPVWMQDLDLEGHAVCVTVIAEQAPRITVRQAAPEELPH